MIIDLHGLSANRVYHTMTQALIPRPIAWLLTQNDNATYNVAPFSYFTAVSSAPPIVMLSVGKKSTGADKDSVVNIRRQKKCVIHIASLDALDALNASSQELDYGESEVDKLGLSLLEFAGFELPRLAQCSLAFACELHEIKELGSVPQSLVFLEVKAVYVDDAAISSDAKGRVNILAEKIKPLARLGAGQYLSAGEILERVRPL